MGFLADSKRKFEEAKRKGRTESELAERKNVEKAIWDELRAQARVSDEKLNRVVRV